MPARAGTAVHRQRALPRSADAARSALLLWAEWSAASGRRQDHHRRAVLADPGIRPGALQPLAVDAPVGPLLAGEARIVIDDLAVVFAEHEQVMVADPR